MGIVPHEEMELYASSDDEEEKGDKAASKGTQAVADSKERQPSRPTKKVHSRHPTTYFTNHLFITAFCYKVKKESYVCLNKPL
jgi:hypothetical protein